MDSNFMQPADRIGGPIKKTGRNHHEDGMMFINLSRDELFRVLFRANRKQTKTKRTAKL